MMLRCCKKCGEEFPATPEFFIALTGTDYQVDHYYPIMGKLCSGLHVPENMRIITGEG